MLKVISQSVYNVTPDKLQLHITSLIEIINLEWRNGRHFLNGQKKRRFHWQFFGKYIIKDWDIGPRRNDSFLEEKSISSQPLTTR